MRKSYVLFASRKVLFRWIRRARLKYIILQFLIIRAISNNLMILDACFLSSPMYGFIMKNRIERIRKNKGLTQEQLGELMGANKGQISKLETGKQPITENWLLKLSKALDVEPWELIVDDETFQEIRRLRESNRLPHK